MNSVSPGWEAVCEFPVDEWFTCNVAYVRVEESTAVAGKFRVILVSACMSVDEQVFTGAGASDQALEAAIRIVHQIQALNEVCVLDSH